MISSATRTTSTDLYKTTETTQKEVKVESQNKYIEVKNSQNPIKSIFKYNAQIANSSSIDLSPEQFLNNIPHDLISELNEIQNHCKLNKHLTQILNGHGMFYNRLILFIKKIDFIMAEMDYPPDKQKDVETRINHLLTDGKINLIDDIKRKLNHLEENYQSGHWKPNHDDKIFFTLDKNNRKKQEESGDFHPKWMKSTIIAHNIPASEVTLAYWNFRHSEQSTHNWRLTDQLIKTDDPALYDCLLILRKLKKNPENLFNGTIFNTSNVTNLHIKAITDRLDYVDKEANKLAATYDYFRTYHWYDGKSRHAHQPVNHPVTHASHPTNRLQASAGCVKKVRSSNSRNQRGLTDGQDVRSQKRKCCKPLPFPTHAKITKFEKEELLKKTGIPEFQKTINQVLEEEVQRLDLILPIAVDQGFADACHIKRAEIISAQDELSRVYDACRRHFGIPKMSFKGNKSEQKVTLKSDLEKAQASLQEKDLPKPNNIPYKSELTIGSHCTTDRSRDLSAARNALITMMNRACRMVSSAPSPLPASDEISEIDPIFLPLEKVINFPMSNLVKCLEFTKIISPNTAIKAKTLMIIQDIRKHITHFKFVSTIWSPDAARARLQPVIQNIQRLQSALLELRNEARDTQQRWSSAEDGDLDFYTTETLLEKIHGALGHTTKVLTLLCQLSEHLKSKKHQELFENLLKALVTWESYTQGIPMDPLAVIRRSNGNQTSAST